jgi:predicted DCC family thiol-disulfide oxidoreductase YuxK
MGGDRPIVLYDADCGFCRWGLAKLLGWDRRRRLRPLPIESEEGRRLLADLGPGEREASWHYVDRAGRRSSAGAAAVPMLRELPGGAPLSALLGRFPGPTERAYRWVADHRSALGRAVTEGAKRRADRRIEARA